MKSLIDDSGRVKYCLVCKNFIGRQKCKAFEHIPDEIYHAKIKHNEQYPGDHGILFLEMTKEEKLERMKQIDERRRLRM